MDYLQIFNLVLFASMAVVNAYWTWQNRKVQNDRDVIRSLQTQLSLKQELFEDVRRKKNEYKQQFNTQLMINKKLEGQLETYKKIHQN